MAAQVGWRAVGFLVDECKALQKLGQFIVLNIEQPVRQDLKGSESDLASIEDRRHKSLDNNDLKLSHPSTQRNGLLVAW